MPRRNQRGQPARGRPPGPLFGDARPRIGDPARDHYIEDELSDDDVLTAYQQRDRWLFRSTRGMNMWEGPDPLPAPQGCSGNHARGHVGGCHLACITEERPTAQ